MILITTIRRITQQKEPISEKMTRQHSQRTKITDKKCKQNECLVGFIKTRYAKYS